VFHEAVSHEGVSHEGVSHEGVSHEADDLDLMRQKTSVAILRSEHERDAVPVAALVLGRTGPTMRL
jgi:hypothetical protein